jgi:hypothetical protein
MFGHNGVSLRTPEGDPDGPDLSYELRWFPRARSPLSRIVISGREDVNRSLRPKS